MYKMHFGVIANTERFIYRLLEVGVKTALGYRRKLHGHTIRELVGRDNRRRQCFGRNA